MAHSQAKVSYLIVVLRIPLGEGCMRGEPFGAISRPLHRDVQRFRGGLVFKANRLCVSLNSRLKSHKVEEEEDQQPDVNYIEVLA